LDVFGRTTLSQVTSRIRLGHGVCLLPIPFSDVPSVVSACREWLRNHGIEPESRHMNEFPF